MTFLSEPVERPRKGWQILVHDDDLGCVTRMESPSRWRWLAVHRGHAIRRFSDPRTRVEVRRVPEQNDGQDSEQTS